MTIRLPVILCATNRLVQNLRSVPMEAGATVWPTPFAVTPDQWFAQLAEEAMLAGTLTPAQRISPYAESLLWEQVIETDPLNDAAALFDVPGMSAMAAEAHTLTQIWGQGGVHDDVSDETSTFKAWQDDWRKLLHRHGWTTSLDQQIAVLALIEQGQVPLPTGLTFAGFDRLNPVLQRLEQVLKAAGVPVTHLVQDRPSAAWVTARSFPDAKAECQAAAQWARAQLAANPQARLGIIAPDLERVRGQLESYLDDALHPELDGDADPDLSRRYNFSLGRALADTPLVATALGLLSWICHAQRVRQSDVSALLRSPYWGSWESEADERAKFDASMRESLGFYTGLDAIVSLASRLAQQQPVFCTGLLKRLHRLQRSITATGQACRLPSEWREIFAGWLELLGWPGDRRLTSTEHQIHLAFGEMLAGLDELDPIVHRIPGLRALANLSRLCEQRIFQPRTQGNPGVQVLGMLESVGLHFDALWVMGMNDHTWPASPRPNPLLCMAWQRREKLPHASAEVELEFCRHVHNRLLHSAPMVTFSYAWMDGNRLLRPSPLIAGIPAGPESDLQLGMSPPGMADMVLERLFDDQAPPVNEREKVHGGTWALRAQAICPAWAFYQFRLGAKALKVPIEGIDSAGRGNLVHCALDSFWSTTKTSAAFHAMNKVVLDRAIETAVDEGMKSFETSRNSVLPPRFRQLERGRLIRLLHAWLEIERERKIGFTVKHCEHTWEGEISGIAVKMTIDRIDVLEDGQQVVIDYKTGSIPDMDSWSAERITEPQLPIYASIAMKCEGNPVRAAIFARVVPNKPGFSGIAEESDLLPHVKNLSSDASRFPPDRFPNWQSLIDHWHERLHAIAEEIKEGKAAVCFEDERQLAYTDVKPILRLAERREQIEAACNQAGSVNLERQA